MSRSHPFFAKASLAMLMVESVQQRLCPTGTVTPEPPYSGERQEAENLPRQLEKAYGHEEMPEGIFYPWLISLRSHVWTLPKVPPPPQKSRAKGSANISSLPLIPPSFPSYNLCNVSTSPLVNHCWLTWLMIWWPLDLYKYIATALSVWP